MMSQIQYTCCICIYNIHLQSIQYYLGTHHLPKLRVSEPHLTKRGSECTKDPWLANFKMGTHVHIMLNISLLLFFIWWSMFHIVLVLNVWYHYTTCYIMSLNVWLVHACTFAFTFFSQIFPKILKYQYDVSISDDIKNNYCCKCKNNL